MIHTSFELTAAKLAMGGGTVLLGTAVLRGVPYRAPMTKGFFKYTSFFISISLHAPSSVCHRSFDPRMQNCTLNAGELPGI